PGSMNTSSSTSTAIPSNLDAQRIGGGVSLVSCRPTATRPWRSGKAFAMADGIHQDQPATGGSGSLHEPDSAGLDKLLWAILSLEFAHGNVVVHDEHYLCDVRHGQCLTSW